MCLEVGGDENEKERVLLKQNAFQSIWTDSEPNIKVVEFPRISQVLIDKYKRSAPNFAVDDEQFGLKIPRSRRFTDGQTVLTTAAVGARIPNTVTLHEYQQEAIASWVGDNYHGYL